MRLLAALCAGLAVVAFAGSAHATPRAMAPAVVADTALPVEKTHGLRFRYSYGYPSYYWPGPYYYPRYYARPRIYYYPRYYRRYRLARHPRVFYRPWWGYHRW